MITAAVSSQAQPTAPRSPRLALWLRDTRSRLVSPVEARHAIHAYYTASPESPDGRYIVYYASTTREAHTGQLVLLHRASGEEQVLVSSVSTEDAHRAACQQWVSQGRYVVYHDIRDAGNESVVCSMEVATRSQQVLARGRQLGWGQSNADLVPVYGPHWDPTAYQDLDLLHVPTGELRTVLTAAEVRATLPALIAEEFGDRPISIFFPVLSPDLEKVFFKIASPLGGHFRSREASKRALLICYSLAERRFLFADRRWGHPGWHPGSQLILDVPNVLINAQTGERRELKTVPRFPGSHPSFGPDGKLYVTDVALDRMEGSEERAAKGEWGIALVDSTTQEWVLLDRFDGSQGATSWRRCHPHPVFSIDGQRIYYTTSDTEWSRLRVVERA